MEGDWHDAEAVRALGLAARVVTLENEFVDAGALAAVQAAGTPVRPGAAALRRVQDKALQKELVRAAGLPTAPSVVMEHAARDRRRRPGAGLAADAEGALAWATTATATRPAPTTTPAAPPSRASDAGEGVLVEAFVALRARAGGDGGARAAAAGRVAYPVVETVQRDHVCHEVIAPAVDRPRAARTPGGPGGDGARPRRSRASA